MSTPDPLDNLEPKQRLFVAEYLKDLNAKQAAIRAGYSEKTAKQQGSRLLTNVDVQAALSAAQAARIEKVEADADFLLKRLFRELQADMADLFDENGGLLPVAEWPLIWRTGLVAGIEIENLFEKIQDPETGATNKEQVGTVTKIKLSDRKSRIELMGKHTKVQAWKEKVEHDVPKGSPLAILAEQLQGTTFRPVEKGDAK